MSSSLFPLKPIATLRAEPAMFGPAASDPTVSRLIGTLATTGEKALTAIRNARSEIRGRVWEFSASRAPDADGQVTVDLDGVLVVAHSDKQDWAAGRHSRIRCLSEECVEKSYEHPWNGGRHGAKVQALAESLAQDEEL